MRAQGHQDILEVLTELNCESANEVGSERPREVTGKLCQTTKGLIKKRREHENLQLSQIALARVVRTEPSKVEYNTVGRRNDPIGKTEEAVTDGRSAKSAGGNGMNKLYTLNDKKGNIISNFNNRAKHQFTDELKSTDNRSSVILREHVWRRGMQSCTADQQAL